MELNVCMRAETFSLRRIFLWRPLKERKRLLGTPAAALRCLAMCMLLLLCMQVRLQAQDARQIMERSNSIQDTKTAAVEMVMELIDSNGDVGTRRLQTLTMKDERGLSSTVAVFLEPASVKNTRFLTIENEDRNDDQWIYLPNLRRVRRIAASEGGSSFMGTDFTYDDMSSMAVDNDRHVLIREESYAGKECYVIESVPEDSTSSHRAKYVSWITKDNYVCLKVEIYDDNPEECTRTLVSENVQDVDGIPTPLKLTMTTVESGHKTVMTLTKVRYNINLDPGYFTTNFLNTGRAR